MKRKASVTEIVQSLKKFKISRKGTNRLPKIKTKVRTKPSYGTKKKSNYATSTRDKRMLGLK